MKPVFSKSLQNLVKDPLLVEALREHFTTILEEVRPRAEQIQKLPDAIIGAQSRAFLTAQSVIDEGFRKLGDYESIDNSPLDGDAGL